MGAYKDKGRIEGSVVGDSSRGTVVRPTQRSARLFYCNATTAQSQSQRSRWQLISSTIHHDMPLRPPTENEIRKIARRTVNLIENHFGAENGLENACPLGSAASALWAS
jgi:hypothetical protein